jgi:hypothetical protein
MPEAAVVEATPQDVQKAFEGGYSGADVSPQPSKSVEKPVEKPVEQPPKEPAAAPAAAKDPWEGVAPVVRDTINKLSLTANQIGPAQRHIKALEDRIAALTSAGEAAKAATPGPTPTKGQIADASQSSERWKKIKEDFPEWAEAMEERLAALQPSTQKPVDIEALRKEWSKDMGLTAEQISQRTRALGRLDAKHEDWEETINTPEFLAWSHENGPTEDERVYHKGLESTAPQQAAQYLSELMRKYPQWWGERGALFHSDSAKDAGKLLDAYAARNKAAAADEQTKKAQTKRLEAAVTPQGVATPATKTQMTAEEAFEKGFSGT